MVFHLDRKAGALNQALVQGLAGVFAFAAKRIIGPTREVSVSQTEAHATMADSLLNGSIYGGTVNRILKVRIL